MARECIGKILVHRSPSGAAAGRIVECEAYRGPADKAAHSSRGRTKRTEAMFGPPGYAYVYLLYGTSWAFNIVVATEGEPHAILVRALEPVSGLDLMAARRNVAKTSRLLTNGPGKLCQALAITGRDYARDLCGDRLYLTDGSVGGRSGAPPADGSVGGGPGSTGRSPRINVDYAGVWTKRPWRFFERHNRYVSVAPRS